MRPIDRSDANPIRPRGGARRQAAPEAAPRDEVQLSRTRTADGRFRVKRGDTKLRTLRETYGQDFAAGLPGNMPLAVLRAATGLSLSQMLRQPEKTDEGVARVGSERMLVRLYEDDPDSPGNGGGYPPQESPGNGGGYPPEEPKTLTDPGVDSPGAGGGYDPYKTVDSPGAGGGYPPADSPGSDPYKTVDSPGAGGGYPPADSPGSDPYKTVDSPGAGGGYPPAETVDSPGAGGGYPPYQSIPPAKEKPQSKEPEPKKD